MTTPSEAARDAAIRAQRATDDERAAYRAELDAQIEALEGCSMYRLTVLCDQERSLPVEERRGGVVLTSDALLMGMHRAIFHLRMEAELYAPRGKMPSACPNCGTAAVAPFVEPAEEPQ